MTNGFNNLGSKFFFLKFFLYYVHNFGDAPTTVPLGFAFFLFRKKPNKRFTYGYGRAEDIEGLIIVFLILFSPAVAAYESISRFFFPQPLEFLEGVIAASIVGFMGKELVVQSSELK